MTQPGPLVAADESFTHQIVDTFARVGQSDRSWTEKVCAMAAAHDGSLQISFGIGKYTNRNVMDAFAGISRGVEQWTVRASRTLMPTPDSTEVGPIAYEVIEPLRQIRFALAPNDVLPIAFEWTFTGVAPTAIENREVHVSRDRARLDADVIRYHQSGTASGWVEVDGDRTDFDTASWSSTRDRSWGVRYQVGAPLTDLVPSDSPPGTSAYVIWFPAAMTRADGTPYGVHFYYQRFGFGDWSRLTFEGGIEHPDGRREPFVSATPDLAFDDRTRRLLGGTITATMRDGSTRAFRVEPLGHTGFHLKTGLYGGFDGHHHGEYRGPLHADGEYIADCTAADELVRVGQHRQTLVRLSDPDGGVGYGDVQSIIVGPHPDLGLGESDLV